MNKIKTTDFTKIPLAELMKVKDNQVCLEDRYWLVYEDCVLIYTAGGACAPQCNTNKLFGTIAWHNALFPGCEHVLIEKAFIDNRLYGG